MNDFSVQHIDAFQCKEWILKKHYAKRMPVIEYPFGLFKNSELLGIITFGTPGTSPIKKVFYPFKLMELNRLVVADGLPKNTLSFFVSKSLKMLPAPLVIVSYADTSKGHHGYIYQATNFIYTGLSAKRTDWQIDGLDLHGTSVADKSRGKEGRAKWMREQYGDKFKLVDRPRKHRYFMFLGDKKQRAKMLSILPYPIEQFPKGDNKRYDSSFKPSIQLNIL